MKKGTRDQNAQKRKKSFDSEIEQGFFFKINEIITGIDFRSFG